MSESTGTPRACRESRSLRACRARCASSAPACSARASGTRSRARGVDVALDDTSPVAAAPRRSTTAPAAPPREDDDPSLIVVAVPPDVTADVIERELAPLPACRRDGCRERQARAAARAARARRRPHALHRLAPARRSRARRRDLGARRHLRRAPLGGLPRRGDLRRRPRARRGPRARSRRDAARDDARRPRPRRRARLARPAAGREPARRPLRRRAGRLAAARRPGRARHDADRGIRPRTVGADPRRQRGARRRRARRARRRTSSAVADALRDPEAPGARRAVADTIRRGNDGVERLPGKHGQNRRFEQVVVMVDDTPGQLGRLFGELGELEVNVEDLRLEHSPGRPVRPRRDQRRAERRAPRRRRPRGPRLEDCEHHND